MQSLPHQGDWIFNAGPESEHQLKRSQIYVQNGDKYNNYKKKNQKPEAHLQF